MLVAVLVSQPLTVIPSQSPVPVGHWKGVTHAPFAPLHLAPGNCAQSLLTKHAAPRPLMLTENPASKNAPATMIVMLPPEFVPKNVLFSSGDGLHMSSEVN